METMVVGSPEHRKYQREEVDTIIADAAESLHDESVFSPDQIKALQEAFWSVRHAIHKVI